MRRRSFWSNGIFNRYVESCACKPVNEYAIRTFLRAHLSVFAVLSHRLIQVFKRATENVEMTLVRVQLSLFFLL